MKMTIGAQSRKVKWCKMQQIVLKWTMMEVPLTEKFRLISCFWAVFLSRMVDRKNVFCKKFLFIFDGVTCFVMVFFCCK